jgi:ADP-ribose pyrophosphatase YjhB (NUDIX family)
MSKIIIAAGPVILENNKVLLIKDSKDDFWKFCGGRVEDNDSNIEETTQREVKEEMGLELEILNDEPFFFYVEKEIDGVQASIILVHFLARRINKVTPSQ